MAEPIVYDFINDFRRGLDSYSPVTRTGDGFVVSAQNAIVNKNGVLTRRPGITQAGTLTLAGAAPTPQEALSLEAHSSGSFSFLYTVEDTGRAVRFSMFDGSSWSSSTTIIASANQNFGDLCYVKESDGTEYIYSVSLGARTHKHTIASPPVSTSLDPATNSNPPGTVTSILAAFLRIWVVGPRGGIGGQSVEAESVLYSALYPVLETWDQAKNKIPFIDNRGSVATKVFPYRDNFLLVATNNALYLIAVGSGNTTLDWQDTIISQDIGVNILDSMVNVGEDVYIVDSKFRLFSLASIISAAGSGQSPIPLSTSVQDKFDDQHANAIYDTVLGWGSGLVWCTLRHASSWETVAFDPSLGAWLGPFIFKDSAGNTLIPRRYATNYNGDIYFIGDDQQGASSSYQLYYLDSTVVADDGATAVDLEVITKANDLGFPHLDKTARWGEISFKRVSGTTGSFKLWARTESRSNNRLDFGDDVEWRHIGTFDYNDGNDILSERFSLEDLGRFRWLQFKITCSDANTQPEINRLLVTAHGYPIE